MTLTRSNSSWWAYIHTYDRLGQTYTIPIGGGKSGGDISAWSSSKNLRSGGSLNLTMVPHPVINYLRHIRPNSVVEFWVNNGDGTPPSCGAYLVNRTEQQRDIGSRAQPTDRYSISCSDFTKVFEKIANHYLSSTKKIEFAAQQAFTMHALARGAQASWALSNPSDKLAALLTPSDFFIILTASYFTGIQGFSLDLFGETIFGGVSATPRLGVDMILPYSGQKGNGNTIHPLRVMDLANFVSHPSNFYYTKAMGSVLGSIGQYSSLWSMLRANTFHPLNEFFVDTRPLEEKPIVAMQSMLDDRHKTQVDIPIQNTVADDADLLLSQGLFSTNEPYFGLQEKVKVGQWAPRVILRKRPYFQRDLLDQDFFPIRHEVHKSELSNYRLGVSDADVKNYFSVEARVAGQNRDQVPSLGGKDIGIINPDSIAMHGLLKFIPMSDFCLAHSAEKSLKKGRLTSVISVLRQQAKTFAMWYNRNEELLNGSLSLGRLRYDIRCGRPLILRADNPFVFYIEEVSSDASVEGERRTSVGVVRGLPLEEGYLSTDEPIQSTPTGPTTGYQLQFIRHGQRIPRVNPITF